MKRVMIAGLIGISLFSLVGCNERSKEVIIEKREGEDKIVLEKINNEKNEEYLPNAYLNGEYYLAKKVPEKTKDDSKKVIGDFEENLYKINKDKNFEETDKMFPYMMGKNGLRLIDDTSGSSNDKIRYFNNETGEEKFFDLEADEKTAINIDLVEGKKAISQASQKDDKISLKIIDGETSVSKEVEGSFEENIRKVVYSDGYYAIDFNLKIYKLEEGEKSFKVTETVDLMKEFNIKVPKNHFIFGNIFLKGNGEIYLEGRHHDIDTEEEHNEACGQALFRYNLKTKDKKRIDYTLGKALVMVDYNINSDYILLKTSDNVENSNEKLFVGKLLNDKIEILDEIKIADDKEIIINIQAIFNEEGNGGVITYGRLKDKKTLYECVEFKVK